MAVMPAKADVVEVQFLRMLTAYLDSKVWTGQTSWAALAVRQAAEEADRLRPISLRVLDPNDRRRERRRPAFGGRQALRRLARRLETGGGPLGRRQVRRGDSPRDAVLQGSAARDRALAEGPDLRNACFDGSAVGKPDPADLAHAAGWNTEAGDASGKRPGGRYGTSSPPSCRKRLPPWKSR